MVKQQYHIFHLNYQIKMFKQLHNTLLWYTNVSDALYTMTFSAKLYKSTLSIYSFHSWVFIKDTYEAKSTVK